MALIKNVEKNIYGKDLLFSEAYIQITELFGNKDNIFITVYIYDDKNKNNILEILSYNFQPSVDEKSSNFIKQGYEYLKTLTEFENAIDVLED